MNEQEIKTKFAARKCETQEEFDRLMNEINTAQTHTNHPYLDKAREIAMQREEIRLKISALYQQDSELKIARLALDKKLKDNNRLFHDLKHELIMLNPKEQYVKADA